MTLPTPLPIGTRILVSGEIMKFKTWHNRGKRANMEYITKPFTTPLAAYYLFDTYKLAGTIYYEFDIEGYVFDPSQKTRTPVIAWKTNLRSKIRYSLPEQIQLIDSPSSQLTLNDFIGHPIKVNKELIKARHFMGGTGHTIKNVQTIWNEATSQHPKAFMVGITTTYNHIYDYDQHSGKIVQVHKNVIQFITPNSIQIRYTKPEYMTLIKELRNDN